ncbi:MAG: FkbM family methyltransferase [Breznakibacter sp.]
MLQYFNGLNDFEEMGLLLHFLGKDDMFVDVGANVGVYSILASGVAGARSIAIEPSDETAKILKRNIAINNLDGAVTHVQCVVGDHRGNISFTKGLEATNRVTREEDETRNSELLEEDTLDNLLKSSTPSLIKIDVEGYELNVLKGARNTLQKPGLKILLIETNGLATKYRLNESDIFAILSEHGFSPCRYSPFSRELLPYNKEEGKQNNTIFVRDLAYVRSKVKEAEALYVNGLSF